VLSANECFALSPRVPIRLANPRGAANSFFFKKAGAIGFCPLPQVILPRFPTADEIFAWAVFHKHSRGFVMQSGCKSGV